MLRESPSAFRPERFVGVTRGTYTWLLFGGGCRRCLGASFALQEMKIVLRAVVERFALAPVGDQEKAAGRSITFSPSRGCEVRLATRVEGDDTRSRQRGRRARAGRRVAGF
jgi:cytochrome P450